MDIFTSHPSEIHQINDVNLTEVRLSRNEHHSRPAVAPHSRDLLATGKEVGQTIF